MPAVSVVRLEGPIAALNPATGRVALATGRGLTIAVVMPTTRVELNGARVPLALLQVGDAAQALVTTTGVALKLEAVRLAAASRKGGDDPAGHRRKGADAPGHKRKGQDDPSGHRRKGAEDPRAMTAGQATPPGIAARAPTTRPATAARGRMTPPGDDRRGGDDPAGHRSKGADDRPGDDRGHDATPHR